MRKNKQVLLTCFLSLTSLILVSCDSKSIENVQNEIADGVSNALPNLYITLAQLAGFLLMVAVVFIFLYKPIKKRLQARKDRINQDESTARKNALESEIYLQQSKDKIKESSQVADKIVSDAAISASKTADSIIAKASLQADAIRQQGEKDALALKEEMKKQAQDEIISSAIDASKEILSREINEKDNEKIVKEFLNQMKQENK